MLNVSVCHPFTTTTARSMNFRSGDDKMNGTPASRFCGCGFSTKKSMSSSSRLVCAMYLRCWRTRNSCNSKYSRTMVSLTAAMEFGFTIFDLRFHRAPDGSVHQEHAVPKQRLQFD